MGILAATLGTPGLGWQPAWVTIGALAALATAVMARETRSLQGGHPHVDTAAMPSRIALRPYAPALAGYTLFGLGYIGYMTFSVTLLREQGLGSGVVTAFYALLGLGVMASTWLWAGLLQGQRGGVPMALLNTLLAAATALPVFSRSPVAVFASGALFGCVFLSVVASTTALVRHNAPPAAWPAGIAAFTIAFAGGQILGPSLVGLVADGPGGLGRGLLLSAVALLAGAALAALQKPLRSV